MICRNGLSYHGAMKSNQCILSVAESNRLRLDRTKELEFLHVDKSSGKMVQATGFEPVPLLRLAPTAKLAFPGNYESGI